MPTLQLEKNRQDHTAFDPNCSTGTNRTLTWLVVLRFDEVLVSMLSLSDSVAHKSKRDRKNFVVLLQNVY
jgi:hypothetical protein